MDFKKSLRKKINKNPATILKMYFISTIIITLILFASTTYFAIDGYNTKVQVFESCKTELIAKGMSKDYIEAGISDLLENKTANPAAIFVTDCYLYYTNENHQIIKDKTQQSLKIDRETFNKDFKTLYRTILESQPQ